MKIGKLRTAEAGRINFRCPGCNDVHTIQVGNGPGPRWSFNGDYEAPTLSPSILVRGTVMPTAQQAEAILCGEPFEPTPFVCHSFVRDGRIEFLGDCTHALAGQIVDLPNFEERTGP